VGLGHPTEADFEADFKSLDEDMSGDMDFMEFFKFVRVIMVAGLASSISKKVDSV